MFMVDAKYTIPKAVLCLLSIKSPFFSFPRTTILQLGAEQALIQFHKSILPPDCGVPIHQISGAEQALSIELAP